MIAEGLAPDDGAAGRRGRRELRERERLAVAVGRLRGERAVKALGLRPDREAPRAAVRRAERAAGGERAERRIVHLQHRAVVAVLLEVAAGREEREIGRGRELQSARAHAVVRIRGLVDAAAA